MKKLSLTTFLFILFCLTTTSNALVFDGGTRRAKLADAPEKVRMASSAVASVFSSTGFVKQENGTYLVKKYSMSSVPNSPQTDAVRLICETELYANEYRAESLKGSAILITPEHVLAPAHIFDKPTDCKDKKIVFNYVGHEDVVPSESVYGCKERRMIRYDIKPEFRPKDRPYGSSDLDGHMDYTVIKLDRPVANFIPPIISDSDEPLKPKTKLYFVSTMRGLPKTVETVEVQLVTPAVVSTNASTAQGSSGGVYFSEEGVFVGIHISSNPSSNIISDNANCLKWVQSSSEAFDWQSSAYIKEREVQRPYGALMSPVQAFKKRILITQNRYQDKILAVQQQAQEVLDKTSDGAAAAAAVSASPTVTAETINATTAPDSTPVAAVTHPPIVKTPPPTETHPAPGVPASAKETVSSEKPAPVAKEKTHLTETAAASAEEKNSNAEVPPTAVSTSESSTGADHPPATTSAPEEHDKKNGIEKEGLEKENPGASAKEERSESKTKKTSLKKIEAAQTKSEPKKATTTSNNSVVKEDKKN